MALISSSGNILRKITKFDMKDDRLYKFGKVLCDYCHERYGEDMHEIVSRARTANNMAVRELSMDKHCCSLLCRQCHMEAPLTSEDGYRLLIDRLIIIYGDKPVREAFERIPAPYRKGIPDV